MDRRILLAVYLPAVVVAFQQGLLLPVIPIYAKSFDVSFTLVSIAVAAWGIGTLAGSIPAGLAIQRFGRRPVVAAGAIAMTLSGLGAGLAGSFPEFVAYRLLAGLGMAMWHISLHSYLTEAVSPRLRGRVLASFGGTMRIGMFIGPAIGGFAASKMGLHFPFLLGAVLTLTVLISLIGFSEKGDSKDGGRERQRAVPTWSVVTETWRELLPAGGAMILGQVVRKGVQVVVPLYGAYVIGLDVEAIGVIMSLAAAVDMAMFFPAGLIQDRFGRKFASVPSFAIMGAALALMPLAGDFLSLLAVTALSGFGNGIGSGTMMTLGADLAPQGATGPFLGLWHLIGDIGSTTGPLLVGGMADIVDLESSALVLALAGVAGAATLLFLVPETRDRHRAGAKPAGLNASSPR